MKILAPKSFKEETFEYLGTRKRTGTMKLITVRQFDNYITANIAKNLLESRDIICFLQDEYTSTIAPFWNIANGGIKLLVHEDDAEETAVLLTELDHAMQAEE